MAFNAAALLICGMLLTPLQEPAKVTGVQTTIAVAAGLTPVCLTDTFPAMTQRINAVFVLEPFVQAKLLHSEWIAVDVGEAAPAGFKIAEADLELGASRSGTLNVELPNPFPVGRYRLDVFLDGAAWHSHDFSVVATDATTPLASAQELLPLGVGTTWTYDYLQQALNGGTLEEVPQGATLGDDGKVRATLTFTVEGTDEAGSHLVMRRGDIIYSEEWWQVVDTGLVVTKREDSGVLESPLPLLPFPLTPQTWQYPPNTQEGAQTHRLYGPIPFDETGETQGYLVVVDLPLASMDGQQDALLTTVVRYFLPGVGFVRQDIFTALGTTLLSIDSQALNAVTSAEATLEVLEAPTTDSGVVGELHIGQQAVGQLAKGKDGASYHTYTVDVPAGTAQLTITMQAEADLDIAAKFGSEISSYGDKGDWDFRDNSESTGATLVIEKPLAGIWYIDVYNALESESAVGYGLEVE